MSCVGISSRLAAVDVSKRNWPVVSLTL